MSDPSLYWSRQVPLRNFTAAQEFFNQISWISYNLIIWVQGIIHWSFPLLGSAPPHNGFLRVHFAGSQWSPLTIAWPQESALASLGLEL